ncbi:hypothetical protein BDA99DRAFT_529980 [Phascolomyces articulosus]|uniref:RING-type domain-containing protein n=1 Tax=Phascolomyces articulosus TaxID=60185 RepID=A0AAD5P7A4_9FUNG|nr:hypothetical protein BDA99DRAFT_529980 [Phascolomyces articulosus]
MDELERLNNNNLRWSIVPTAPSIALIQRGDCNWSEKLEVARNISMTNNLNLTAILIYNNATRNTSTKEYHLYTQETLQRSSYVYSDALPSDRNISFMNDNDLMGRTDLPMPIYFAPASYGNQFIQFLANNTNTNSQTKVLWQLTPILIPFTSTKGTGDNSDDDGDSSPFSRGYLSYVIALAAIFLVALFAGVIFLRWWRVRQMREQREYEAQLSQHAYNIQMRMQAKPLPVDIVNSIPISKYKAQAVKNANCAICLEDYEEDKTEVRILGCGHGFCVLCIDPWLTQKSTMCPICKWDCLPPELQNQDPEATITGGGQQPPTSEPVIATTSGQPSTSTSYVPPSSSSTTTAATAVAATTATTATTTLSPTVTTESTHSTTIDIEPTTTTTDAEPTSMTYAAATTSTNNTNADMEEGSTTTTTRDTPTTPEVKEGVLASSTNDIGSSTSVGDTSRQSIEDHVITIPETETTSNESSSQVKNLPEDQQHQQSDRH